MFYFVIFFFFKQQTAYEMRISDWSSDVCSSDLAAVHQVGNAGVFELSQDSALLAEARDQAASDAVMHDLDRHPLLELAVAALAQVHRTHAAATDLADDAINADLRGRSVFRVQRSPECAEVRTGFVIPRPQPPDFLLQGRIAIGCGRDPGGAFFQTG